MVLAVRRRRADRRAPPCTLPAALLRRLPAGGAQAAEPGRAAGGEAGLAAGCPGLRWLWAPVVCRSCSLFSCEQELSRRWVHPTSATVPEAEQEVSRADSQRQRQQQPWSPRRAAPGSSARWSPAAPASWGATSWSSCWPAGATPSPCLTSGRWRAATPPSPTSPATCAGPQTWKPPARVRRRPAGGGGRRRWGSVATAAGSCLAA